MNTNVSGEKNIDGLCGVVTLYYPELTILKNIASYADYLHNLIVVDNTPSADKELHHEIVTRFPNAELVVYNTNRGVASALNAGVEIALEKGYSWLLTMDQDSFFPDGSVERYFKVIKDLDVRKIAVVAPGHKLENDDGLPCYFIPKEEVMTSGSLINLKLLTRIGFFDDRFFIDSVDHDYCFRARIIGYEVMEAVNCCMRHKPGQPFQGSFLWGKKQKVFWIHSPRRMYFIVRNGLYINHLYKKYYPEYFAEFKRKLHNRMSRCVRYSPRRIEYIKYILKGYVDYYLRRFGNRVGI